MYAAEKVIGVTRPDHLRLAVEPDAWPCDTCAWCKIDSGDGEVESGGQPRSSSCTRSSVLLALSSPRESSSAVSLGSQLRTFRSSRGERSTGSCPSPSGSCSPSGSSCSWCISLGEASPVLGVGRETRAMLQPARRVSCRCHQNRRGTSERAAELDGWIGACGRRRCHFQCGTDRLSRPKTESPSASGRLGRYANALSAATRTQAAAPTRAPTNSTASSCLALSGQCQPQCRPRKRQEFVYELHRACSWKSATGSAPPLDRRRDDRLTSQLPPNSCPDDPQQFRQDEKRDPQFQHAEGGVRVCIARRQAVVIEGRHHEPEHEEACDGDRPDAEDKGVWVVDSVRPTSGSWPCRVQYRHALRGLHLGRSSARSQFIPRRAWDQTPASQPGPLAVAGWRLPHSVSIRASRSSI